MVYWCGVWIMTDLAGDLHQYLCQVVGEGSGNIVCILFTDGSGIVQSLARACTLQGLFRDRTRWGMI